MNKFLAVIVLLVLPLSAQIQPLTSAGASTNVSVSDPQAVTLVQQANLALTGGATVADVTLNASVAWIAGSTNETGTATLQGKGTAEARLAISAGTATRTEIRNDTVGPSGQFVDASGKVRPVALHNCWTPAAWFAPHGLVQSLSGANTVLRYIGTESDDGVAVDHIQAYSAAANQRPKIAAEIQKLSTTDLYLDATSHLPVLLRFNTHPDNDLLRDIPVEVRFSAYQPVNGIAVPFHIQRFLAGTLQLDLTITSAAFNTGISDSAFAAQ